MLTNQFLFLIPRSTRHQRKHRRNHRGRWQVTTAVVVLLFSNSNRSVLLLPLILGMRVNIDRFYFHTHTTPHTTTVSSLTSVEACVVIIENERVLFCFALFPLCTFIAAKVIKLQSDNLHPPLLKLTEEVLLLLLFLLLLLLPPPH